ncbi:MAG: alpha/beta fold hydrolase [Kofleriaceae bacterium]
MKPFEPILLLAAFGCSSSSPPIAHDVTVADDPGCGSAHFLHAPSPVGARTIKAANTTIEVWYPASEPGTTKATYDLRDSMPPDEAKKIPDADNALLTCDCYRDLPLDTKHGPYPTIVFLHGAASFRAQSASLATYWASRGFVVVAPDLPGVGLSAILSGETAMPSGTVLDVLDALQHDAAFTPFNLDGKVALVGHSLGAILAATAATRPEVTVTITMAGFPITGGTAAHLALYGDHDSIAPPPHDLDSTTKVISGAGHLAFTDLCSLGADRGGALAIAKAHGVPIPAMLETLALDGCRPTDAPASETGPKIRAATTGILEERMHCR